MKLENIRQELSNSIKGAGAKDINYLLANISTIPDEDYIVLMQLDMIYIYDKINNLLPKRQIEFVSGDNSIDEYITFFNMLQREIKSVSNSHYINVWVSMFSKINHPIKSIMDSMNNIDAKYTIMDKAVSGFVSNLMSVNSKSVFSQVIFDLLSAHSSDPEVDFSMQKHLAETIDLYRNILK